MKYLGAGARKVTAYSVASVSGTVLAVCSCSVLPMFAGIYRVVAGLGPASAFLYSGPAINVLAIILTARVLGLDPGEIQPDSNFVFDLGAESSQSIQLVAGFEEEFNIDMDDEAALAVQTVGDAVDFIAKYL